MSFDDRGNADSRKRMGSDGSVGHKRPRPDVSAERDLQQAKKTSCYCCSASLVPSDSRFLFSCECGAPACAVCFSRALTQAPFGNHLECPCCWGKCSGWTVQNTNEDETFTLPAPDPKLDPVRYHQSLEEPSKHLTISLVSGCFVDETDIAIPQSMTVLINTDGMN